MTITTFAKATCVALATALTGLAPLPALAQTGLQSLQTGEASKGWSAVGRLEIGLKGFCTAALVAPDLVLTAAHCLFDRDSGARVDPAELQFLAGMRNGRAEAYRAVRRAVIHPDYRYGGGTSDSAAITVDIALLELDQPIRSTFIEPYGISALGRTGTVGVVSYAIDRAEAPALEEVCDLLARRGKMLIFDCDIDFGSSGAPVFRAGEAGPEIVSVISAKAQMGGQKVAVGPSVQEDLPILYRLLDEGRGTYAGQPAPTAALPPVRRFGSGSARENGAKFIRPGGS